MKNKWLWILGGVVLLYVLLSGKKKPATAAVTPGPGESAPTAASQLPDWLRSVVGLIKPTNSTAQRSGTGQISAGGASFDLTGIVKRIGNLFKSRPLSAAAADKQIQAAQFAEARQVFDAAEYQDYTGPERVFSIAEPWQETPTLDLWWQESAAPINFSYEADFQEPANWVDDNYDAWDGGFDPVNDFAFNQFAYV